MSQEALLSAVRDHLRRRLDLPREAIDVMFDGRPAPSCGEWFVSVHEGDWRADESIGSSSLMLPESLGVLVTVTRRVGYAPFDRIGTDVLARERKTLTAMCRKVVAAVHMSYEVMAAAITLVGTDLESFHKPQEFRDGGRSTPQGPGWFQARGTKTNPPCGLSRTLTFDRAQSVQTLENMR